MEEVASAVREQAAAGLTLILRKTKIQARIAGWNPDIWGNDDYCISTAN